MLGNSRLLQDESASPKLPVFLGCVRLRILRSPRITVVSIPCGPSALAVEEAAWGLARYDAISHDNGHVPIVEPEILLDGDHPIERTLEVAEKVWFEVFFYLTKNNVMFQGILLKPSMVTLGLNKRPLQKPLRKIPSQCSRGGFLPMFLGSWLSV